MHLVYHIPQHNYNVRGKISYMKIKDYPPRETLRFATHPPATGGYPPLGTALPGLLLNISACGPGPVL